MSNQLLTTKLHIPQLRPNLVSPPRLIKRLGGGLRLGRRLALVSALAGYGKTTRLSETYVALNAPSLISDIAANR